MSIVTVWPRLDCKPHTNMNPNDKPTKETSLLPDFEFTTQTVMRLLGLFQLNPAATFLDDDLMERQDYRMVRMKKIL